jgi:hypothetical protein
MKVNNFDVLKKMSADNLDIRMAPDILGANYSHKTGTKVTVGVPGNICFEIMSGELVGCLLLWNKKQFEETKKALENSN